MPLRSEMVNFLGLGEWIPASSYSSTLGLTNRTKGPEGAPVWTIAILEPQSTLVENRPAASTAVGQAGRRPAGLFRQPCLPRILRSKLDAILFPISQGTKITIVIEYVILTRLKKY